jgi:hypothetical protein
MDAKKIMVMAINPDCEWQVIVGTRLAGTVYKRTEHMAGGYLGCKRGLKKGKAFGSRGAALRYVAGVLR